MRKASKRQPADDLRPEYDFSALPGGVRGKYVERCRAGVNLALLDPEVAEAFPTDEAVNEALRTVMHTTKVQRRAHTPPNKRMLTRSEKARRRGSRS